MELDHDKIDDVVLALLALNQFGRRGLDEVRAWKGMDWDALNRLYEKGLIYDPKNKAKSVVFSDEGLELANELLERLFAK
ncbi:MAG TPA: DUF6429 family protein [Capsulimonadaceae bacterium]